MNSDKLIKNLTIATAFFLPVVFNPLGFDVFALPRIILLYLFGALFIFITFIKWTKDKKISIQYAPIIYFLPAFIFFVFISFIFSAHKHTALFGYSLDYEGLLSWICYFLSFYAGYLYFRKAKDIEKLFAFLSIPLLLVGTYAVIQYFFDIQLMEWMQKQEITRASSFLGHPSYLGIYCIIVLPAVMALLIEKKNLSRAFYALSVIFGFFALILSLSRGAWIAALGMGILFFLLNFRHFKKIGLNKKIISILIIGIIFACVSAGGLLKDVWQRFLSILNPESSSIKVRLYLYKESLLLLKENWLVGIGADNYAFLIPKYFSAAWETFRLVAADKAHNQILDYWISFGIGGILTYLSFLVLWFRKSISAVLKSGRNCLSGKERIFLQSIIISSIGYLIAAQFHYSSIELAPIFFLFLGIGAGIMAMGGIMAEKKIEATIKFSHLPFISAFAVFFAVFFGFKKISADCAFAKAMRSNDLGESIALLESAIENNPYSANYYFSLNELFMQAGKKTGEYSYFEKAIKVLNQASGYFPQDYRIYYILGETYLGVSPYAQNRGYVYGKAADSFSKTLELYPNFSDAHLKLGVSLAHAGKENEALDEWDDCVRMNKTNSQCYYNLHVLYGKMNESVLSEENYEKYLMYKKAE
ncbi:hypothetical protein A2Y83_00745 [Candidatus Falkowbacteria bacterium RBG_13_39_14]|uniref:O-antigen ligase-related domain-containing protein n=1 Tax=Candidatus Falkowbacteria bacterium RBG_13_39_14 TaxID=1797985 RepID=A0A1F5S716_9BACT|nr:MAG: hypothetical protein A2Y83_00745 [Candidatus Falkowbacteria bacterium RBG_13_39_14]